MDRKSWLKTLVTFVMLAATCTSAWACVKTDTRWSATSNVLYIENPVSCTLTQLAAFVKPSELELIDPVQRIWLLKASIRITGGGSLILHGTAAGGDVNTLRMLSANSPAKIIRINPRWGTVDIRSTHIQSWDPLVNGPDTDSSNGRSYIHAESFLDADGVTPRESRMDIVDSEIDHLGYYAAVSYGLVWKVIGDVNAVPDIYDRVEVYGSLINSYVHHNYMGFYSYGALGIEITDNEVAFNESYGIDPHDDSDKLFIARNLVHDNGAHGIICSRRCDGLTIVDNEIYNSDHGIMLHREVVNTLVANNYSHDNRSDGIALFESHNNKVSGNVIERNQKAGVRVSLGSYGNVIEGNTVNNNLENGLYLYKGEDPPETTDGRPRDNVFRQNTVSGNGRLMKVRDADRIKFENNVFAGTSDIQIYDSTEIDITGNVDNLGPLQISSRGAVSGRSEVRLEADRNVETKFDEFGAVALTNPFGRIFKPEENGSTTLIEPEGSKLVVSYPANDLTNSVSALPLFASTTAGAFTVSSPVASQAGVSWIAGVTVSGQPVQFRVVQLKANTRYRVFRDSVVVGEIVSNSSGELSFSDLLGPGQYSYKVSK